MQCIIMSSYLLFDPFPFSDFAQSRYSPLYILLETLRSCLCLAIPLLIPLFSCCQHPVDQGVGYTSRACSLSKQLGRCCLVISTGPTFR